MIYQQFRRRNLDEREADRALARLLAIARVRVVSMPDLAPRSLSVAFELGTPTTYDCEYIALAEEFDCPLWTADDRLMRAMGPQRGRVKHIATCPLP